MSEDKSTQPGEKPDIVVDEDWKSQAEAEKRKLAEAEKASSTAAPAGAAAAGEKGRDRSLPQANFTVLVSSLVTQILFALGAIGDTNTGKRYRDLALAKHNIDMLSVLEEKTKGNLTEEEKQILDGALYEVRMAYVQVAQGGGG